MNQKAFHSFFRFLIEISTYFILLTPLVVSGLFFFPFVGPKGLYLMAMSQIIFFSWVFLVFINRKYLPKINPILISLIIFLFFATISSIFGVSPSYSFWSKFERMTGLLVLFHLFAFFLALSSTFETEDFEKFLTTSVFISILAAIYAFIHKGNEITRGGGTLGNDSFLGTYLVFNLFFNLYLLSKANKKERNFFILSFLILSLFLLLSGARAAKVSFLGGIALFFILILSFHEKKIIRQLGRLILILSIPLVFYLTFSALNPQGFIRKNFLEKIVGPTFGGRFTVWEGAIEAFKERPWFGWGPENFEYPFIKYFNPCYFTVCGGDIWYDRAHNFIFDYLISMGILGLLSYVFVFLSSLYFLWKLYFLKKVDIKVPSLFTALFAAYFVQNLTVFDMPTSYLMIFLTLSFLTTFEKRTPKNTKFQNLTFFHFLFLLPIFFCFLVYFVILPAKTGNLVIEAIKLPVGFPKRIKLEKEALSTSPLGKYQIREFFTDNAFSYLSSGKVFAQGVKSEFEFLASELEKSVKENTINFRSYLKLAEVYYLLAKYDYSKLNLAEEFAKRAIELSPKNQQGYWILAKIKVEKGELQEALSLAQEALELEPNFETSKQLVDLIKQLIEQKI